MSTDPPAPVPTLPLPPDGDGCASGCAAGCALTFVGTFVALAVSNLIAYRESGVIGIVASVLWLALVAFVLILAVSQAGVRGSVIACLGPFSRRPLIDIQADGDRAMIGFGYELFGRRFYYLRVAAGDINSVDMSTGQATGMAGRDMNDWSVAVWYRSPTPSRFVYPGVRDDEVYIVGPAAARAQTAELLAAAVAFFRAAGISLEPGESETEFRRVRE